MEKSQEKPITRTINVGCLVVVLLILLVFVATLSLDRNSLKYAGKPFLFIPDLLGLVQTVKEEEVRIIKGTPRWSDLEINSPGGYFVYLPIDQQVEMTTEVYILDQGEELEIELMERGARPYDTVLADGVPKYRFTIENPGTYRIRLYNAGVFTSKLKATVVPDYVTGKELLISLFFGIELFIIGWVIFFLRKRKVKKLAEEWEAQKDKQIEYDEFLDDYLKKYG